MQLDKIMHLIFGLTIGINLPRTSRFWIFFGMFLITILEPLQSLVPYRGADINDFVVCLIGLTIGVVLTYNKKSYKTKWEYDLQKVFFWIIYFSIVVLHLIKIPQPF